MDRVLHVVSSLERGGTEAFIMNNFRTIDRNEIQFDFLFLLKKSIRIQKKLLVLEAKYFGEKFQALKMPVL